MSSSAQHLLPRIGDVVSRCVSFHHVDMEPGTHLGLPAPALTVVLAIGPPTRLAAMPDPAQEPAAFMALAGGLHLRPAVIAYDGTMCGIQLDLTPQAARRLFGIPAAELVHGVYDLHVLLGPVADELLDRLHSNDSWDDRLAAVDEVLARAGPRSRPASAQVDQAWRLIVTSCGTTSTQAVADAVGWSRRHLDREFRAEFGLTPKEVARVARFTNARALLQRSPATSLADLSAACGYFDQSHMAREWNLIAGVPASTWWASEGVRFFQGQSVPTGAS